MTDADGTCRYRGFSKADNDDFRKALQQDKYGAQGMIEIADFPDVILTPN